MVYYVERESQPEVFTSIPAAMWWGVVTLTTVGYGDVYPITPIGKFIGALVILVGIGMFALPAEEGSTSPPPWRSRGQAAQTEAETDTPSTHHLIGLNRCETIEIK